MKFHDTIVNSLTVIAWLSIYLNSERFFFKTLSLCHCATPDNVMTKNFYCFRNLKFSHQTFRPRYKETNISVQSYRIGLFAMKILNHLSYESKNKWAHQTSPNSIMPFNERLSIFLQEKFRTASFNMNTSRDEKPLKSAKCFKLFVFV